MDWAKRMEAAAARDKTKKKPCFTEEDVRLAQLWTTCPISEHAGELRMRSGDPALGPEDIYLVLDGLYFTKGVEEDDFALAWWCWNGIIRQIKELKAGTDKMTRLRQFLGPYWKETA